MAHSQHPEEYRNGRKHKSWAERLSLPDMGFWAILLGVAGTVTVCCIEGGMEGGQNGGELENYAFWESRQDSVHACGMGQLYLDGQCNFPGRT